MSYDIVVRLDGEPVTGVDDLIRLLNGERIGRAVTVDVLRRGQLRSFEVHAGRAAEQVGRRLSIHVSRIAVRRESRSTKRCSADPGPRTLASGNQLARRQRTTPLRYVLRCALDTRAQPFAFIELNMSKASFGFMFLCTTAPTAAIIAFGASDWKMLRPMSTPAAPCCTAL